MPVLDQQDRAALLEADVELSGLQSALEAAAQGNAIDRDAVERLRETAQVAVARVSASLPMHIDADARDEIRRRLLDMLTFRTEEGGLLDLADRALIEAEAVRHVVRDLLDEQPPLELRDEGATIRMLEEWLPGMTVGQLSELAGISVRQLQRRRRDGGGMSSPRLQLVARLAAILRHAWTDRGVLAWFAKAHPGLGGRTPMGLLDDPERERDLLILARAGRVQGAS
jgi:transcriptional regulator with XRE-family HTH domain